MELLPAVDLRGGQAVRLVQGDFERESAYGDPVELARAFVVGGARWLHLVDLDAARTGRAANRGTLLAIAAEAGVPVQAGGGVRRQSDLDELLAGGVARVVLGTVALEEPRDARRWAEARPGRVALGLDYRRRPDGRLEAAGHGWAKGSGVELDDLAAAFAGAPLAAVVATAIERDGTLGGPDLEGLGEVLDAMQHPVVASGGVGSLGDLADLGRLRSPRRGRSVEAVVVGRALVDGRLELGEAIAACAPCG